MDDMSRRHKPNKSKRGKRGPNDKANKHTKHNNTSLLVLFGIAIVTRMTLVAQTKNKHTGLGPCERVHYAVSDTTPPGHQNSLFR